MAYVDNSSEEQEAPSGQPAPQSPVIPGGGSGDSGGPSADARSSGAPAQPKLPANHFPDIANYLAVNAPQGFGSQVAGKVSNDITKGQQTLDSAEGQFKQLSDQGVVKDNQGLIGQVAGNPQSIDANAYQALTNAKYTGPSSLSDSQSLYNQVQGQTQGAVDKANASKTEGGRFALLDNYFSNPNYSQGQKSLDNLLIQNDPASQQAFAQVQQNATGLQQNANQANIDLANYANQNAATTANTNSSARAALGIDAAGNATGTGAFGDITNQLNAALPAANAQQQADDAAIRQAFASNNFANLTPAQRTSIGGALGADQNSIDSYYGVDPSKFISDPTLNLSSVVTPDQQARYNALANLAGVSPGLISPTDTTVGSKTAPGSDVQVDYSGLNNAIGAGKQAYNAGASQITNKYQPTISAAQGNMSQLIQARGGYNGPGQSGDQNEQFTDPATGKGIGNYNQAISYYQNLISQQQAAQQKDLFNLQKQYGVNGAAASPIQSPGVITRSNGSAPVVKR